MQENILNALRTTSLMHGFTVEEIRKILASSAVNLKKYRKDEIIFYEGDTPQKLYLLLSGTIRILKDTYQGRQIFIGEIRKPGSMFGEIYLFIEKQEYDMYTMALTAAEILEIDRSIFQAEEGSPLGFRLQKNLLKDFANKAYQMNNMIKVLASGTLRGKIARYLLLQPATDGIVHLKESRETTAIYLAVSRPALSRELGAMQKEGILELHGREIRIVDRALLEECI
ncbi:Crp/Fnr family transcriptional regulator [Selenomonas sp. TAMA-11512]|uniref:Crp/Fnr family transcriptional regulator n=1 Tax=Selenomonas sp. TAMA-11512 TaxID=3095337 RepID=UPI0030D597D5